MTEAMRLVTRRAALGPIVLLLDVAIVSWSHETRRDNRSNPSDSHNGSRLDS